MKTAEGRKRALLAGLVEIRARILEEASELDEQLQDEIFLGTWSLKDILAHLAGWDITNAGAAREILDGLIPEFYGHWDEDWASYNAKLIAEYKRDEFEALIEQLETTHLILILSLEHIPAREFDKERSVRKQWMQIGEWEYNQDRGLRKQWMQIGEREFDQDRRGIAICSIVPISRLLQKELDHEKQHLEEIQAFADSTRSFAAIVRYMGGEAQE